MDEFQDENKRFWYAYNGTGDPYSATNYRKITIKPAFSKGSKVSAIFARQGGDNPQPLSGNLHQYISNALFSAEPQPPLTEPGNKYYVYVKD